ncbi:structural protein MipA [Erythrobacter sp. HI0019]|jgi:outer membrane scaffolding protein for murein synthesis (MipA/OmpV family)|uniref:MipA/OmpV family protein n=1 Tax=unclassified Erythrobacter TaxID=2633097 RepID=UPI0007B8E2F6|nr:MULTISPECIES: MipA/OmpV family protein [unclassified Erythrobacter]KZX89857.1 structural protein MipA [Erythrobacter sp. HI0019]KZY06358.1 structural protein MipA [Erythrobacter sp. HI0028]
MKLLLAATGSLALTCAAPAMAQNVEALPDGPDGEATVFDGNWFSIGAGAVYSASYDGSDDYVVSPIPIVQGKIGGVRISPRAGGAALDFVNDDSDGAKISAGVAARLNRNRASQIEDPVVLSYGELDTAFEVGPSVGISLPGLLNPYDSLSFNIETLFDVAGAHDGTLVSPGVTYFTPVSRGAAISLSVSGSYVDDDYADYYYSVPAGGALPAYQADGGWDRVGVNLLTGVDLDGNLANGGLALIAMGGYSRMLGDGKRTPFTSIRGDADQWMGALGIGYTF